MNVKLPQKEQIKERQKKLVNCLLIISLIKLQGSEKLRKKIIQKQLNMSMIKKYQKKYLKKKGRKLSMT